MIILRVKPANNHCRSVFLVFRVQQYLTEDMIVFANMIEQNGKCINGYIAMTNDVTSLKQIPFDQRPNPALTRVRKEFHRILQKLSSAGTQDPIF